MSFQRFRLAATRVGAVLIANFVVCLLAEEQASSSPLSLHELTEEEFAELASFLVLHYQHEPVAYAEAQQEWQEASALGPPGPRRHSERAGAEGPKPKKSGQAPADVLELSIESLRAASSLVEEELVADEARRKQQGKGKQLEPIGFEAAAASLLPAAASAGSAVEVITNGAVSSALPATTLLSDTHREPPAQGALGTQAAVLVVSVLIFVTCVSLYVMNTDGYAVLTQDMPLAAGVPSSRQDSTRPTTEGGCLSDTTEQFIARLEEIIEQMAAMLRGTVQVQKPGGGSAGGGAEWRYIAAVPSEKASSASGTENVVPALDGWSNGHLAWWSTMEAFTQCQEPLGQLRLVGISGVLHDEKANPNIVAVQSKGAEDTNFVFRSFKEARTWSSTLTALIEQLHDED